MEDASGDRHELFFRGGYPFLARGEDCTALLGQILVAMGALRPQDLSRGLARHTRDRAHVGKTLVRMGLLGEALLMQALLRQMVDTLRHAIEARACEVRFEASIDRIRTVGSAGVLLHPYDLAVACYPARLPESDGDGLFAHVRSAVGGAAFTVRPGFERLHHKAGRPLLLSDEEVAFVSGLVKPLRLADALKQGALAHPMKLRVLSALVDLDLIDVKRADDAMRPARPTHVSPERERWIRDLIAKHLEMKRDVDLYRFLGVNYDVTPRELDAAYRKVVGRFHPDRLGGDLGAAVQSQVGELFAFTHDACERLSDAAKRVAYDRTLWRNAFFRPLPSYPVALGRYAERLIAAGQLELAREYLAEAERRAPHDAFIQALGGFVEVELGDVKAGLARLRMAARRAPAIAGIHRLLGQALESLGRLGAAERAYHRATYLAPGDEAIAVRLAEIQSTPRGFWARLFRR
ncbi:MAG: DnaJ domain-containing protein [Deltaproteobacteria bacterium]|nr:DnaJ domain-containing protein [Deltaproteobacteria bacterium]